MKQTPKRTRRCGPTFPLGSSSNNVMPWNRIDQKMTLYLCETARRALRELRSKHPTIDAKTGRSSAPVLQEGAGS
jgi:hypothetical protein